MFSAAASRQDAVSTSGGDSGQSQYLLWIDGVGTFLLCLSDRITIGGPTLDGPTLGSSVADVALLANLSRKHVTIERSQDGYLLEAHSRTNVAGREVRDRTHLNDGYDIELGNGVKLRFRLPNALSSSARLEFVSDHRPAHSVDGIVLMADTCLLGPGNENHVQCPDWEGSVLLLRKEGTFWCKSRMDMFVDNQHASKEVPLNDGDIVTGPELRFRLELASS